MLKGTRLLVLAVVLCSLVMLGAVILQNDSDNAKSVQAQENTPTPEADSEVPPYFDGERALEFAAMQVDFGVRPVGSEALTKTGDAIIEALEAAEWEVVTQEFPYDANGQTYPVRNIVAKRGTGPITMLASHYDTRMIADNDPDPLLQGDPVLGANDAASSASVLLEMAEAINDHYEITENNQVWLVFFDAEDNGRIDGWDWILGSRAFAEEIPVTPRAVVIVDMIGDADLNIHLEKNSDKTIRAEIWETAASLGYGEQFINAEKYSMLDDHTPFLEIGIPAVDIIDFDYAYWHTTQDTPDKVSPESLHIVGDTLWHWVVNQGQ